MLDILRKRKRSWVIVFLIGIIVVVFALWGVGSYVNDSGRTTVAVINGETLTPREFEIHYQRFLENYRNLLRGALTEEMIRNLNLRGAVLEELIQRRLLLQEAQRLGLGVGDEELRSEITRVPVFTVDGRFSKSRYLQALRSSRLSPEAFETEQREQLTIQRLYAIIRDSVHVAEAELKDRYRLKEEKLDLHFMRFVAGQFLSGIKVTPDEVKSYYERNRESFKEPPRVQVEYVSYPFEHFAAKVEVSEKEIEDYYQVHKATRFHQPKAVRLRHILLRIPQPSDLERREQIRVKAQGILREARAGKAFPQLAKEYSEDPSAAQGGEIGWVTQGQLLPDLDKIAFSLRKDEISDLAESPLGYHILKVEETQAERTKGLKEATPEIISAIKAGKAKTEAGKAIDADRARVLSGTELSVVARERAVSHRVSPWFSSSEVVPEVGPVEPFNKAAFSLAPKELAPAVEAPKAYYLVRGKERKQAFIPALETVRAEIEKKLRETKASELATQRARSLLEEIRKEKDLRAIARRHGLGVEETGWFTRSAPEIPKIGMLREVQPLTLPLSGYQPVADRVYTQGNAAYVIALKASQEADPALFAEQEERLREELLGEKRQRALERFVESLKAKARIEVRPEYLEQG
ncbi:MAG: SurA N-terminal domain-containing protein [Deltaproteobacteria bacterium]|nr:SurA N-terminal domain-containing protein [Deltaproteobacteria bacterium]